MYSDGEFLTACARYRDSSGTAWAEVLQLKTQGTTAALQALEFGTRKSILALVIGCRLGLFSMDSKQPFLPKFRGYRYGPQTISIGRVTDTAINAEVMSWISVLNLVVLLPGLTRAEGKLVLVEGTSTGTPTVVELMQQIFSSLDVPIRVIGKYVTISQIYASNLTGVTGGLLGPGPGSEPGAFVARQSASNAGVVDAIVHKLNSGTADISGAPDFESYRAALQSGMPSALVQNPRVYIDPARVDDRRAPVNVFNITVQVKHRYPRQQRRIERD